MFKVLNNHTAPNLRASFTGINDSQINYQKRNEETDLIISKPKSEYLKKTFKYNGAVTWNALSTDAKLSTTLSTFKRYLEA